MISKAILHSPYSSLSNNSAANHNIFRPCEIPVYLFDTLEKRSINCINDVRISIMKCTVIES